MAEAETPNRQATIIIENMMQWHHSGFSVYCGDAIWSPNEEGLENLALADT